MSDISMVQNALWDDYYKVAWVNILTGEYRFVKILDTDEEKPCLAGKTIYEYSRLVVDTGLIPEEDIPQYRRCTDRDFILREVMTKRKRITVNFRRQVGSLQKWLRLEIVLPQDFSENSPWAVYTWKESDAEVCNTEDSMRMLAQCFHKILKVDLTADSFDIIKAYPGELTVRNGFTHTFSGWLRNIAAVGSIHTEDIQSYTEFVNPERLKNRLREHRGILRLRYRRKYNGEFRWVNMEIVPSVEYTDEKQIFMLYVRDIHDEYISELHRQKALEYLCNYDTLTGVHSRFCFNDFCESFEQHGGALAVLFADVNGLKYTNDTMGHEYGDRLITGFAELLTSEFGTEHCFRISGDEFIVLMETPDEQGFMERTEKFHGRLWNMEIPQASIGAVWSGSAQSVDELVRVAESRMYDDKHEFYKLHPEMKR